MDLGSLVNRVVDTGRNIGSAISSGASEAGKFVAQVVKDDVKDALTTARMVGLPGMSAPIYSKVIDEGYKLLGWHDLADKTNPEHLSGSKKASAAANTVINAASFVPGLGAGVKAAQAGVKSSKLMTAGTKLTHEGIKKKLKADVSENAIRNVYSKMVDATIPKNVSNKMKDAMADESLKLYKELKKGVVKLTDKPQLAALRNTMHKDIMLDQHMPQAVKNAVAQARDEITKNRFTSDFLTHAGKVTINKGLRTSIEAVKHGVKVAKKQAMTQVPNTARKVPKTESSDTAYQASQSRVSRIRSGSKSTHTKKKKKNRIQF